ncbi:Transcription factor [Penicillium capsulatum]|nr:Transcription factor [Penicillium capsulatum]
MSQHDNPKFPPLAPGPPRIFAPQSPMAVSRPKKNSTACLSCKTAKRKCSGPPSPCKACISAGSENDCHFDPSRDLRRKVAVKRTIQELTDYKDVLFSLLQTIRTGHIEKVEELTALIRDKDGSIEDIAHLLGHRVSQFSDPRTLSTVSQLTASDEGDHELPFMDSHTRTQRPSEHEMASSPEESHPLESPQSAVAAFDPYARVSLESLCDIPLFQVPAKPWTNVTSDNGLVSHLVSLYFTWDHPCAQFVDQAVFLRHMAQGDLHSEVCTPLLVNSLLAMASVYSDSPDVYLNPSNAFSRGQAFLNEAERLWRSQEEHPSLSNIQALLLMCSALSCQGKRELGWMRLNQALVFARGMGLFMGPEAEHHSQSNMTPEVERIRTLTSWGLFSLNLQISSKVQKSTDLARPASNVRMSGHDDVDWTPYPRLTQITYATQPAHLASLRYGIADLADIMAHIQALLYDEESRMSFGALMAGAESIFSRLQKWLADWPDAIQFGKEPISQLLILRVKCLQVSMDLLERLVERDHEGSMAFEYRRISCQQAKETARCLRLHRQAYGLKYVPSQVADSIQAALRVLVHSLKNDSNANEAFIELCRFAIVLGQKFRPISDTVHHIQSLSLSGVVRLPAEAVSILDGSEIRRAQDL